MDCINARVMEENSLTDQPLFQVLYSFYYSVNLMNQTSLEEIK